MSWTFPFFPGILNPDCNVQMLLQEDSLRSSSEKINDGNDAQYRKTAFDPLCGMKEREHSLTDQTLYCRDCNQEFTFTSGEQEFYASRGLTNTPSRCPECRAARKQAGGQRAGFREREARPMYTAICASCGNEATVPFQPREDRPVYCRDCFQPQPRQSQYADTGRSRW
jgi:CxxC-x17-CxxC domain-containing protein